METENPEPPDKGKQKHRTVKCKLKTIIACDNFLSKIDEAIIKINQIVIYAYQFLRMFILERYDNTIELDRQFIYNLLKAICSNDIIQYQENDKYSTLFEYYNANYKKFKFAGIDSKNISYILQYASIEIITCLENNIMNHFKDYLNKYINILFLYEEKKKIVDEIKDDKEKKKKLKELSADLKNIKIDLYTNSKTVKYEGKHIDWLKKNRQSLVPQIEKDNINYHLKKDPVSFLKHAIYINKEIEKLGKKCYQLVPQRNNSVPKHITFDHAAIVDLLGNDLINKLNTDKKKAHVMLHPKEFQKLVFDNVFNTKHSTFKQGSYVFNYQFKTDGISAVLDFVNFRKYKYEKKKEKEKDNNKNKDKTNSKKITQKELLAKPKDDEDYKQLEKLNNKEIKEITDKYNIVANDPGKKSLSSMINKEGKVYQYNAVRRRHDCYFKASHMIMKKEKEKNKIVQIEKEFTDNKLSCKTLDPKKYLEFIHKKNEVNSKTNKFYHQKKFRNIKFRVYCRTKQSEANLLNEIAEFYGHKNKPIVIGYGNWSRNTQMKNFFPTPGKGFRNLIASRFKIVIVDEYKTSITCNQTETEMTKWKYKINDKLQECHKVLTSIKDTNPKGEAINRIFIDRDINAAKNILKIIESWLKNKTRPEVFCRKEQHE